MSKSFDLDAQPSKRLRHAEHVLNMIQQLPSQPPAPFNGLILEQDIILATFAHQSITDIIASEPLGPNFRAAAHAHYDRHYSTFTIDRKLTPPPVEQPSFLSPPYALEVRRLERLYGQPLPSARFSARVRDIGFRLFRIGPHIRHLTLHFTGFLPTECCELNALVRDYCKDLLSLTLLGPFDNDFPPPSFSAADQLQAPQLDSLTSLSLIDMRGYWDETICIYLDQCDSTLTHLHLEAVEVSGDCLLKLRHLQSLHLLRVRSLDVYRVAEAARMNPQLRELEFEVAGPLRSMDSAWHAPFAPVFLEDMPGLELLHMRASRYVFEFPEARTAVWLGNLREMVMITPNVKVLQQLLLLMPADNNLQRLGVVVDAAMSAEAIEAFGKLQQLRHLCLRVNCKVDGHLTAIVQQLGRLPKLNALELHAARTGPNTDVAAIGKALQNVQRLRIGLPACSAELPQLSQMRQLRSLWLTLYKTAAPIRETRVEADLNTMLRKLAAAGGRLHTLRLYVPEQVQLTELTLKALRATGELHTLEFGAPKGPGVEMFRLAELQQLERLTYVYTEVAPQRRNRYFYSSQPLVIIEPEVDVAALRTMVAQMPQLGELRMVRRVMLKELRSELRGLCQWLKVEVVKREEFEEERRKRKFDLNW